MSAWPEKHIDVISAVRKNGLAVTKQTPGEKTEQQGAEHSNPVNSAWLFTCDAVSRTGAL
jgi:hypothetical protein